MKRDQGTYGVRTSLRSFNSRSPIRFVWNFFFFFFFHTKKECKIPLRCLMRNLTQRDNPTQFGRFNDRRGVTNCRMSIVLLDSDRFRPERNRIL